MSLTYGYNLKDGDKILEAPKQLNILLRGLITVQILPFCAISDSISACYQHLTIASATHSFMGPISQLRTNSPKR